MITTAKETPLAPEPLGPPPVELLSPFERFTFRAMELLQKNLEPATTTYLQTIGNAWMWRAVNRVLTVQGLDRLDGVRPHEGIVLVANHRSYFDLYVLAMILERRTHLHQPVWCPVRADFFYEHPLGVLVNLLVGAGHMYPPVFRDRSKQEFNKWALAQIVDRVRRGNVIIGFHPEGMRNKNPDPYVPLPAQPGVGKLVMETWPVVIPVFFHGITNNLFETFRNNFAREKPLVAVFGKPVDLSSFRGMSNRLATHKRIADRLLEQVYRLGDEEKAIRAALPARCPMPDDR